MKIKLFFIKTSVITIKTLVLTLILLLTVSLKAQTFRIQEVSVNPNCDGTYCVSKNSSCLSSIYSYSYPSNVNNYIPANPPIPSSCLSLGAMPDSIWFTYVSKCSTTSFWVNLNGVAKVVNCTCGLNPANHNFSATIQSDPQNYCDYLITVYY